MLIHNLHVEHAGIIVAAVCSLIVAGLLKGVIGIGMPVVALPLLALFIDVKSAAMLLSMPLVLSNLPQALEGGRTGRSLIQLTPVFLGMIPGLWLGVQIMLALDTNVAKAIAGVVLIGVGGVTLLAPKLRLEPRLILPAGVTFGFLGGLLGGIAAILRPARLHIHACQRTARTSVHKGSIAVSRGFLGLARTSSDGKPSVHLA